jgi:hypothetical protein
MRIKTGHVIEPLVLALQGESPFVRHAAADALRENPSERIVGMKRLILLVKYWTLFRDLIYVPYDELVPGALNHDPAAATKIATLMQETGTLTRGHNGTPAENGQERPELFSNPADICIRADPAWDTGVFSSQLQSSDVKTRESAVTGLGKVRTEKAVEALIPLLRNSDGSVRCRAGMALRDIGSDAAIDQLAEALSSDKDPTVKTYLTGLWTITDVSAEAWITFVHDGRKCPFIHQM